MIVEVAAAYWLEEEKPLLLVNWVLCETQQTGLCRELDLELELETIQKDLSKDFDLKLELETCQNRAVKGLGLELASKSDDHL